ETSELICSECSKVWVKNPVGMNVATGKFLTVRDPFSWWVRADDLVVAAQVLIAEWREARAVYFGGLPQAATASLPRQKSPWNITSWLERLRATLRASQASGNSKVPLSPEQQQAHGRLRVIAVAEMLIGMAFECAAKAIIIGADESIVDDKRRWDALTRDHNLARYFDQTPLGKTLSQAERKLLTRLQEAIEWRGRYPGGKKNPDVHMQVSSEEEFEGWYELWRRLCEHARYEAIEPPDS
ncbi:MAG: hypothetical protein U1E51_03225, partial [Candidatus Binatia bacterium]|nr:hypothetical protein [Candidatus Binatia bacterium]